MADPYPDHRVTLAGIARAARGIDPVFRDSPQYACEPLSQALGCQLTIKVETLNPIRSFKGRGVDHLVAQLLARGQPGPFVCASAGNFGQAMAYVCRRHRIALTVFAAREANALKVARMRALGAEVRLHGEDFDEAKQAAHAHAARTGATMIEDGLHPEVSEGAGTIALELLRHGGAYDSVLVPLGDGALLNGIARWFKAAAPGTRVYGVCATGAPAMAHAFALDPSIAAMPSITPGTIADGIAVRTPIARSVADMRGQVAGVLLVDDGAMVAAMRLLHAHAGLVVEPAGAAGLAALLADPATHAGQRVATVLCGGNLTPAQMRAWLLPD